MPIGQGSHAMTHHPVTIHAVPDAPPPELLDEIGTAAAAWDALRDAGHHLHFDLDAETGRLTIQMLDHSGRPVADVPPHAVLQLAAGAPLRLTD